MDKFDFIIDTVLSIVTIIGMIVLFVFLIKKIKLKIKKSAKIKKEKLNVLYQEKSEFVNLTQKIYEDNKTVFDKERCKYVVENVIMFSSLSIFSYIITKYFYDEKLYEEVVPSIIFYSIIIIEVSILAFFYYKSRCRYKSILGSNIVNKFLDYSNLKLKYYKDFLSFQKETNYSGDKHKEIVEEYSNANFDNEKIDGYEMEDYINGFCKDTFIQLMDASFYKIIHGRKGSNRRYIFNGNLTIIDKGINNNHIKIISNKVNDLDSENIGGNYDFNTYFKVFARDMETLDSYLTSDLKNLLLDFRNKYKIEFDIVLKDKIYIRFYTKNMFELKIFGNPIDEITIYQYYAITKFAEELVELLNDM